MSRLLLILLLCCAPISAGKRDSRLTSLNKAADQLTRAILSGDTKGILSLCGNFNVEISTDWYLSCAQLRKDLSDKGSWLYCNLFDTACLQQHLREFSEKSGNPDAGNSIQEEAARARCVRDILREAGSQLKDEVSLDRLDGKEQLNQGSVFYVTPQDPNSYGDPMYPHSGFAFSKGRWVLSSLFSPF